MQKSKGGVLKRDIFKFSLCKGVDCGDCGSHFNQIVEIMNPLNDLIDFWSYTPKGIVRQHLKRNSHINMCACNLYLAKRQRHT